MLASDGSPSRGRLGRGIFYCFCVAVLLFLILPLLVVIPLSFSPSRFFVFPPSGFSGRWYIDFATNPVWVRALQNSLLVSVCAALVATLLGTLAAWGLSASRSRWAGLAMALLIAPMAIPIVVIAVSCFLFYSSLGLSGTYVGLIIAHAALGLPFVVIAVSATLKGFNHNLLRAAESLGSPPLRAFVTVAVPVIFPGVLSGALFAFAVSFDEAIVALFLTSPLQRTLPVQIFSGMRESITPTITAAATILMGVSVLLMVIVQRISQTMK